MAKSAETRILELVWASALFVGEGCASILRSKKRSGIYPSMSIVMQDERAITRFKDALSPFVSSRQRSKVSGLKVVQIITQRNKTAWGVKVSGQPAVESFLAMLPHLRDTEKGDQIVRVLKECGLGEVC